MNPDDIDGQELAALREELKQARAELEYTKEEWDGTDGAHPCWWRGSDMAVKMVVQRLQLAISGDDGGEGFIGNPGLEAIRRWILARNGTR